MTIVNTETGELTEPMDADAARRLTERIRIAAANYTDAKAKVLQLVDEAKAGSAHLALGYKSWTAYLSDVLSDEPLRLAREDRRELENRLADEGMSSAAIAPIVGVTERQVRYDINPEITSELPNSPKAAPVVRTTTGLDGRERTGVTAGRLKEQPAPSARERSLQESELITAFRSMVRPLLAPKNVESLSPKSRALLVDLLERAIQTLKGTDQ